MRTLSNRHYPQGAVIVTLALVMLFLGGLMAIALDFGRLFIAETELQTAMDSCALAAAKELDGQSTALTRAASAGQTAGNLNKVNLQPGTWSGEGKLNSAEITFKDASYVATTVPANAKYAQCQHTQSGIGMWLLQSAGAFSGDTADYPNTQNVMALAVATRSNAQTACPTPEAFKPAAAGQIGWTHRDGPCTTSGLPGSTAGPPAPVLVR